MLSGPPCWPIISSSSVFTTNELSNTRDSPWIYAASTVLATRFDLFEPKCIMFALLLASTEWMTYPSWLFERSEFGKEASITSTSRVVGRLSGSYNRSHCTLVLTNNFIDFEKEMNSTGVEGMFPGKRSCMAAKIPVLVFTPKYCAQVSLLERFYWGVGTLTRLILYVCEIVSFPSGCIKMLKPLKDIGLIISSCHELLKNYFDASDYCWRRNGVHISKVLSTWRVINP